MTYGIYAIKFVYCCFRDWYKHTETLERLKASEQLFLDTIEGNEDAVAEQIEKIHMEETSHVHLLFHH